MEDNDSMIGDEIEADRPRLTLAIVELAPVIGFSSHQAYAWVGMDSAPHFPRLQRYLAQLTLAKQGEIARLHVESSGLPEPIDLCFDHERPTIH